MAEAKAYKMLPVYADAGVAYQMDELVRCKDCKWYIKKFENEGRCIEHDNDYHEPDWFCADGERRTDDA